MLGNDSRERKATPVTTGVLDFFPDAIVEVARVSLAATKQHHPDQPMHWDKSKSTDEADALVRHLLERGTRDHDGQRHTAKVAWRALALLQRELDAEKADEAEPGWALRGDLLKEFVPEQTVEHNAARVTKVDLFENRLNASLFQGELGPIDDDSIEEQLGNANG